MTGEVILGRIRGALGVLARFTFGNCVEIDDRCQHSLFLYEGRCPLTPPIVRARRSYYASVELCHPRYVSSLR